MKVFTFLAWMAGIQGSVHTLQPAQYPSFRRLERIGLRLLVGK
jgi:hypothetical protein